jgi:hypothetical protein
MTPGPTQHIYSQSLRYQAGSEAVSQQAACTPHSLSPSSPQRVTSSGLPFSAMYLATTMSSSISVGVPHLPPLQEKTKPLSKERERLLKERAKCGPREMFISCVLYSSRHCHCANGSGGAGFKLMTAASRSDVRSGSWAVKRRQNWFS